MSSSDEELKSLLIDAGNRLQKPPTSVKELIALLDRVEVYLSRVEQSPSKEIQDALSPTMKALVGDQLLKHTDADVKVSVASCISEITRITAPEVPYEDENMKEVFQLIVWSFGGLPDTSSQSFIKRTSVLETVAKVRSCVVMLDLECDELILEMFRHFIKTIRDYHSENVYSCMESIMTRVINESEEISSDMLFCILDTVRNGNMEVTPIAQKLLKKVIETCADKLKPCLEIAMKTKGVSLADYDEVVNRICNKVTAETVIHSEQIDASVVNVTEEATQAVLVNTTKPPADGITELVMSNGNASVEADTFSGSSTLQDLKASNDDKTSETVTAHPSASISNLDEPEVETNTKASETIIENPKMKDGDLDAERVDEVQLTTELKVEKVVKKRGRKPKAKKKASEPKLAVKSSNFEKQSDDLVESHKSCKEMSPSPKESVVEAAGNASSKLPEAQGGPSEEIVGELGDKLDGIPISKTVISSSDNHTLLDEQKTASISDLKEETNNHTVDTSEFKAIASVVGSSVDKTDAADDENVDKTATLPSGGSQEVAAPTIDETEETEISAGKSPEKVDVPSGDSHMVEDGLKTGDGIKKRGRDKTTSKKLDSEAFVEENNEEASTNKPALQQVKDKEEVKENPKTSHKRKLVEMNSNESKDYGEELVGSKVKVWWPADKRFYKGVIELYDFAKKKHKVLYADGEVEHLVLKKQRWAVIDPDEDSDTDEETQQETPATEKRSKSIEVDDGSSKKRLGRPPSKKSDSASSKPNHKRKDNAKSDSKSRDDPKVGGKAKTDNSKEEEKSTVESSKKLGRPRGESSSKAAGKSKSTDNKSIAEDAKSSEKLQGSKSKVLEDDNSNIKSMDIKVKETKAGKETLAEISARKSKNKMPSKSKSDSNAKNESISPKTSPSKASGDVALDHTSGSKGDKTTEKQTRSPAIGSLKRKASPENRNKSKTKPELKGKKMRKN